MVQKKNPTDLNELDTREKIMEVAMNLFAVQGFNGASIREIAKLAEVNIASVNYHFKSKENLRQEILIYIINDFSSRISSAVVDCNSCSEYAVKLFKVLTLDSAKCLNQFKLILEAEAHPCGNEPYPAYYEHFSNFMAKELNSKVPDSERLWMINVVFCYVVHMSVMSSTAMGRSKIENFFPDKQATIPSYIKKLVESLIRDLNQRYAS